jgi:thiopeptide-type bacteriocin biosynthesis protein
MTQEAVFTAEDVALLRIAALPAARAGITHVDLDPEGAGYDERLLLFIRSALTVPELREALEVSSGSLARTLDRIEAGGSVDHAKLRRAAFAVARYLLRMTGRPTPFGLLAGVAAARFTDAAADAKVRLGDAHQRGVRADMEWLTALVMRWEQRPDARRALLVTLNDLCFERAGRLVLPYVRNAPEKAVKELSVRLSAPVRRVLALTEHPVRYEELLRRLCQEFPRVTENTVDTMLGRLVQQEILLTDLRPPPSATDPLGHVIDRLSTLSTLSTPSTPSTPPASAASAASAAPDDEVAALRQVAAALTAYAARPIGAGRAQWREAVRLMRELHVTERPPIQVDLRVDADVRLPPAVAAEVEHAASALWRMSSPDPTPAHLSEYHDAFLERYGSQRLVPIRELLDPEAGLGAPAGYLVPAGDRPPGRSHERHEHPGAREQRLAALAQEALLGDGREVVLDDAMVAELARDGAAPPAPTAELCVQVLAESLDALHSGDFRLVLSPMPGSPTAGAIFGRFAYLLDDGADVTRLAAGGRVGETVQAQLVFQPVADRAANVTRVPTVLDRTLAVGTFADRRDDRVLRLDDIAVGAGQDRMYLVSAAAGRELVPFSPHVLNTHFATPNAVRLIREIAASGVRGWHAWDWGAMDALPRLPRVRYGRTVLAPARWRPVPGLRDAGLSWSAWCDAFDAWRATWEVPDRVQATVGDHRVELDLTVPLHRQLLRHELQRRTGTILSEPPARPAELGWIGGHANEVVVPLTVTGGPRRSSVRIAPTRSGDRRYQRRYQPGGEWLYGKLYSGMHRHDEVLADRLPALLADLPASVDRWFFIRYGDPEPHLRLRFHGAPDELNKVLLPALHDWAERLRGDRLARRLVLDTYDPELVRYGGPDAIGRAEEAFAADSAAVLTVLRLRRAGALTLAPELIAAIGYVTMIEAFGDDDWDERFLAAFPKNDDHSAFQRCRRAAVQAIDPYGHWAGLLAAEGGGALLAALRRRAGALAGYGELIRRLAAAGGLPTTPRAVQRSLLHMHHNRLIGIDPGSEGSSYAIARGAVEAHRNRLRCT